MSPFQLNERSGTYPYPHASSSSLSSYTTTMSHREEAMKDVEARPIRRVQSSPLSCLPPFSVPSLSSEESVFAITRNFLKYQVPVRLQTFSPRNASSSKRSGSSGGVEDDGGVEVSADENLRRSYDLSRV